MKRIMWVVSSAIVGLFAGLPLGQILGTFVSNFFYMFAVPTDGVNGIVIGGLIGSICGAILGAGFFLLAKTVLSTNDNPVWEILLSTLFGLGIGVWSIFNMSADFMRPWGAGQSIGITVGAVVCCFAGIRISIKVLKMRVIVSEEEKRNDDQYAQFLKNRAKAK
jgi:hypothetical protein